MDKKKGNRDSELKDYKCSRNVIQMQFSTENFEKFEN